MTRKLVQSRRRMLCALAAAAVSPFALAQGLSKRPVRIVVPFTPAAGPDIVARLLAPRLQARWDQPFFVENKPGASGTIGTEVVSSEEHTSELQSQSNLVCRLLLEKKKKRRHQTENPHHSLQH